MNLLAVLFTIMDFLYDIDVDELRFQKDVCCHFISIAKYSIIRDESDIALLLNSVLKEHDSAY
jgi:hypothetical protein